MMGKQGSIDDSSEATLMESSGTAGNLWGDPVAAKVLTTMAGTHTSGAYGGRILGMKTSQQESVNFHGTSNKGWAIEAWEEDSTKCSCGILTSPSSREQHCLHGVQPLPHQKQRLHKAGRYDPHNAAASSQQVVGTIGCLVEQSLVCGLGASWIFKERGVSGKNGSFSRSQHGKICT